MAYRSIEGFFQLIEPLIRHDKGLASGNADLRGDLRDGGAQRDVLPLLVARRVQPPNHRVAHAVLLSEQQQPRAVGCVRPRDPVGIRRALLTPHALHRVGPPVATPSAPIVLGVRLAVWRCLRVDHERMIVDDQRRVWA